MFPFIENLNVALETLVGDVFIYNGKWLETEAMIQKQREKAWPRCREQVTGYPMVLFIFVSW